MPAGTKAPPRRRARLRTKLLLAAFVGTGTLLLLEGGLWLFHPIDAEPRKRLHRFLPSYSTFSPVPRVVEFDPGPLPGVTPGVRQVVVNQYGFLYPEAKRRRSSPAEVRVAVLGGSTTECAALPEDKRWPAVLETLLQDERSGQPVTVLNLGLSATDTRTHLATVSEHVTGLDVDLVVFLLGANDLSRVAEGDAPLLSPDNFYAPPRFWREVGESLRRTQIGRHLRAWRRSLPASPRQEPYFADAVQRQEPLPPFDPPVQWTDAALRGYARAIVSLAGLCQAHGITPLFATQPAMLTRTPSAEELAAVWGLHDGTHRLSPANFVDLLDAGNACLVETCGAHGYACVDLARSIPPGLACFYDQVHCNEPGARRIAEVLLPRVHELLAQRPSRR